MCDYSLHIVPNRLAEARERLIVTRFQTGSLGFAPAPPASDQRAPVGFWKTLLRAIVSPAVPSCAVCVPPGAKLRLLCIPKRLQREFAIGSEEEVTFTQISAEENSYRDAVRFRDGATVLLQRLEPGQSVVVLNISGEEEQHAAGPVRASMA